jgi:hypothetical protein
MNHAAVMKSTSRRTPFASTLLIAATLCTALFASACSEESQQQDPNLQQFELVSMGGRSLPYPPASERLFRELLALYASPDRATQLQTFRGDNSEIKVARKLPVSKTDNGYMINFDCELDEACPGIYSKEPGILSGDTLRFAGTTLTPARVYVRIR